MVFLDSLQQRPQSSFPMKESLVGRQEYACDKLYEASDLGEPVAILIWREVELLTTSDLNWDRDGRPGE